MTVGGGRLLVPEPKLCGQKLWCLPQPKQDEADAQGDDGQ